MVADFSMFYRGHNSKKSLCYGYYDLFKAFLRMAENSCFLRKNRVQ